MNLLKRTQKLCALYDIRPARSRGQNFLIKEDIYNEIIDIADIKKEDIILEVGPGLGFLTAKLAEQAEKVIAVELDDKLTSTLNTALDTQGIKNVEVINKNILDLSLKDLGLEGKNYKIVANLPYNITSVFLRKFLEIENKPQQMTLMLQKEVAERIVAKPPKMSLLAISVQFYADAEIVKHVPRQYFWPQPEVDSVIIKLEVRKSIKLKGDKKQFFRLVKTGFSSKRKMLKNNLAAGYQISQQEAENKIKNTGFSPKTRAQELSIEDWVNLFGEF